MARLGGDEFVVGARLAAGATAALLSRVRAAGRFALDHPRGPVQVRCATGLATSARPDDLLALADAAMYRDKPQHR